MKIPSLPRTIQDLLSDGLRTFLLLATALLAFRISLWISSATGEPGWSSLTGSAGIIAGAAFFSHVTRRILFPRLHLQQYARRALGHPVGAGLVVSGICVVVSSLLLAHAVLLG